MSGEECDMASTVLASEVFKALGDPIRWNIVQQVAQRDEFACSLLEDLLPVSKPTISYHTKILTQAGLLEVRKRGRNYFYTLRRDVLGEVLGELWQLAPTAARSRDTSTDSVRPLSELSDAAGAEGVQAPAMLTW
jgi:DNA-binding transcriptional ArsR family regulator